MSGIIIGIDPDTDKNGVAIYERIEGIKTISFKSLPFFGLFDFLVHNSPRINTVVIEGGWLNSKSNFRNTKGTSVNATIGKYVGANHETGRKIVEMCEYLGVTYRVVKPLRKIWKGRDGKITHPELENFTKLKLSRTNQEQRDAALLVWGL